MVSLWLKDSLYLKMSFPDFRVCHHCLNPAFFFGGWLFGLAWVHSPRTVFSVAIWICCSICLTMSTNPAILLFSNFKALSYLVNGPRFKTCMYFLLLLAFTLCRIYSLAVSFPFFGFFWSNFFFCAASCSGVGGICSFSIRIISMWQGELMSGWMGPWAL